MNTAGKVSLIGAGPGDPGLITVRAVECLARADLILYDYLVNPALLRYAAEQVARLWKCAPDRFIRGYRYCAVTRNLQMLGAFGFLSRIKQKKAFEHWIPSAASMLAGHIRAADQKAFPKLTAIAKKIGLG